MCVCITFCSDGNDHVCRMRKQGSGVSSETNTVASADAEKSSETEGAEVNVDESSGADMSATEAAEETSEAAETTAAEPLRRPR